MKTKRIVFSVLGLAVCSAMVVHPFDQTQKNTYAYFNTPDINTTLVNDTAFSLGDVNGDMAVNADDASMILAEYSVVSTSNKYTFSEEQIKAGDVNADGAVDAADASLVLSYYAYTSTGGNISIEEHIKLPAAPTVTTTTVSALTTTQTTATTTAVTTQADNTAYPCGGGEGCQYFGHMYCHKGNEGYPDWYGVNEKSNYIYAYNQAVVLGSSAPSSWASSYVLAVNSWGADRVMIGDPTDGEGYNNVWVLKGYTEDGDEIWTCGP